MKIMATLLVFFLACVNIFAQPGPPIPFSTVIQPINKELELDPDNDEARVRRIKLFLRGGNYEYDIINITVPDSVDKEKNEFNISPTLSDLQYLENRWKAGKNKEFLTSELIHALYGETYEKSNPELSKKHYIAAAKFNKKQLYYEGIFNAYKKLNEIDSALIYHDSLNLLFYKNSTSLYLLERFWHQKIELLVQKKEFTQELVDYYNWLSTENFGFYEKVCQNTKKGEYISKSDLESGLNFQYDLCEYYFKHKKFKQFFFGFTNVH
jgi:hypothetical protein